MFVADPVNAIKEVSKVIYLAPQYYNYCQEELSGRLNKIGIEENIKNLALNESHSPSSFSINTVSFSEVFKRQFALPSSEKHSKLIYRLYEIREELRKIAKSEQHKKIFKSFVSVHDTLHACQLIGEKQSYFKKNIEERTSHYFQALHILLTDGIKRGTDMFQFEGLLKGTTKILIVDDFPSLKDNLLKFGFSKKNTQSMPAMEFMRKYLDHKKDFSEEEKKRFSIRKFIAQNEEFKVFDLVYLNFWRENNQNITVHLSIKLEKILGAEEEAKLKKDPAKIEAEKQTLTKDKEKLNSELDEIMSELMGVENGSIELKEAEYIRLEKKRKKTIAKIKKVNGKLKKLLKPNPKDKDFIFLNIDLVDVIKKNQSWRGKVKDMFSGWGLSKDLVKQAFKNTEIMSVTSLQKLYLNVISQKQYKKKYQKKCQKVDAFREKVKKMAISSGYLGEKEDLDQRAKSDLLNVLEATVILNHLRQK